MLKNKSFTIIFLLCASFLLPWLVQMQPVAAQVPGNIVNLGDVLTGSLDEDNPRDYYGIIITEPGRYNISAESVGTTAVYAALLTYIFGYPMSIDSPALSNGSRVVSITAAHLQLYGECQVSVYLDDYNEEADYTVSVVKLTTMTTVGPNTEVAFEFDSASDEGWFVFEANAGTTAYNLTMLRNNTLMSVWNIYTMDGMEHSDFQANSNRSHVLILNEDEYYVRIESSTPSPLRVWAEFIPIDIPVLHPGDSVTEQLNDSISSQQAYFYNLQLEEGMYYSIEATCEDTVNADFRISKGPGFASYWTTFNFGLLGDSENVTDLIYFGQYAMWTGWDQNLTAAWERTAPQMHTNWEGDLIDHSMLVLELYAFAGGGEVNLSISEGTPVPTLAPEETLNLSFNNTIGPLRYLVRVTGTAAMNLYEFNFGHVPTVGSNISTSYNFYGTAAYQQDYLYFERPFLTAEHRQMRERSVFTYFGSSYSTYDLNENQTEYQYQPLVTDNWLLVQVPDAVSMGGYTAAPLMEGTVELGLETLPTQTAAIGASTSVEPHNEHLRVLRFGLTGGHTYEIAITATNSSVFAWADLINSTGYIMSYMSPLYGYNDWIKDTDTQHIVYHATFGGEYALLMEVAGDAPVSILITDLTASVAVDIPFVLIGIVGAAAGGLVIGAFIGKVRFGAAT